MKNFLVLVAFMVASMSIAQEKITEGVLVQSQSMSSADEQINTQLAMMGEMVTTTHFKNDKSRSIMSNPMMGKSITIIDNEKKEMLVLMDNPMMGKKYMKEVIEDVKLDSEGVEVVASSESKVILGYDCKKYDVNMVKQGQKVKMIVYATENLNIVTKKKDAFEGKLKGFPLYMEMYVNQMGAEIVVKIETTSVVSEKVDISKFDMTVPPGYEKTDKMPGM